MNADQSYWPSLPLEAWQETYTTLHLWTQIVGKIRLEGMPWVNHSWHVPLYVTSRGLTTSSIPHDQRIFEIEFDFINHQLAIRVSDGAAMKLPLRAQSVAAFYQETLAALDVLGIGVSIHETPNEIPDAIPFPQDHEHAAYDPDYANRFWRILVQSNRIFEQFRARFIGKSSPVHFFWGSFDLAVTRFSGRTAPLHPAGIPNMPDWVAREAYSHEVSSAGFWPGGGPLPYPLFYSYAYPTPEGFADTRVLPKTAFYSTDLGEFVLPYDEVRAAENPDTMLLDFLESTYVAAADLADWNREELEQPADLKVVFG
jgi:hypothetical protein